MTHPADSHDLIRVQGARVNNLKDVTVELPKRRLTVFTGVSGSGKSSLVFGTIAAESQRLINETYSAFVQGFMPSMARPDVDVLDGLTTAIIVDQERMGANARSTVGTATDANAMLRILFSKMGKPHIGGPNAFSFNTATVSAKGAMKVKGETKKVSFERQGGMCPRCEGMGRTEDMDLTQIYDENKSINQGAIKIPGYSMDGWQGRILRGVGHFDPDKPIKKFTKKELDAFLYMDPTRVKIEGINLTYAGLVPNIQKSFLSKDVDALQPHVRAFVERAMTFRPCPECDGTRLSKQARSSKINGKSIADLCAMQISDLADWVRALKEPSVKPLLAKLQHVLDSFVEIGLGYLSLDRSAGTLSGGESQRTKMIRHLGSSLTDVTYVFDEPTIGLHPHDIANMNDLLLQLRDKGNTVLVVEHKPEAIAIADHVVDLGPGAGTHGGEVCFEGTVDALRKSKTLTGKHLDDRVSLKDSVRERTGVIEIRGASQNNLQKVDVDIPLGVLCVITGVAGSGKSSLIHGSLPTDEGVVIVDQGAIRGSRRSNPGTYTGLLEPIRKAFAKANNVKPALFSANSEGACPTCNGNGVIYSDIADHGRCRHALRGLRRQALRRGRPHLHVRRPRHQRGPRAVRRRRRGVLLLRHVRGAPSARHPRTPCRRRPRLHHDRPAPHDPVGWRAPASQAGDAHGGQGWRVRPRRTDDGSSPRRCRTTSRSARPTRRRRKVRHRDRAPPSRDGPRRLARRPRSRRRPRWRQDRVRRHARRPRQEEVDPHRQAPRRLRPLSEPDF